MRKQVSFVEKKPSKSITNMYVRGKRKIVLEMDWTVSVWNLTLP